MFNRKEFRFGMTDEQKYQLGCEFAETIDKRGLSLLQRNIKQIKRLTNNEQRVYLQEITLGDYGKWILALYTYAIDKELFFQAFGFKKYIMQHSMNPMNNGIGFWCVGVKNGTQASVFDITPHFVNRFKQRYSVDDEQVTELIKKIMPHISGHFIAVKKQDANGYCEFLSSVLDHTQCKGIMKYDFSYCVFKTFLGERELKASQEIANKFMPLLDPMGLMELCGMGGAEIDYVKSCAYLSEKIRIYLVSLTCRFNITSEEFNKIIDYSLDVRDKKLQNDPVFEEMLPKLEKMIEYIKSKRGHYRQMIRNIIGDVLMEKNKTFIQAR